MSFETAAPDASLGIGANSLDADSYTAVRLKHATPSHLYITTRRCFIGPIPEDWLKRRKHRKTWYKYNLNFSSYSSRTATFSAGNNISYQKRTTGIDGSPATAKFGHSFPQPEDAIVEEDEEDDDIQNSNVTIDAPPNLQTDVGNPSIAVQDDKKLGTDAQQQVDGAQDKSIQKSSKSAKASSFVTAPETRVDQMKYQPGENDPAAINAARLPTIESPSSRFSAASSFGVISRRDSETVGTANSTSSLLHYRGSAMASPVEQVRNPFDGPSIAQEVGESNKAVLDPAEDANPTPPNVQPEELQKDIPEEIGDTDPAGLTALRKVDPISTGLVRFNIPDRIVADEEWAKTKLSRAINKASFRKPKVTPGVLIKSEKMLVRVDSTIMDVPPDYDENLSMKLDCRPVEKWREFMVVCRKCTDETADFIIQMYKSRVIPEVEKLQNQKRCAYEIPLVCKKAGLNLYSTLDKTIVLWAPYKKETRIYILRPRSSASSVEWYSFLKSTIGGMRPTSLKVRVPDLDVNLQLGDPFKELGYSDEAVKDAKTDALAMMKLVDSEKTAASSIVHRCMKMLKESPEWGDVIDTWIAHERMGLAWKRYDRLEWIHGANEQRLFGTWAMEKSHDLELRPKQHYPTAVLSEDKEHLDEPPPVEGYLIRLTSQKGREQRFGKMFSKRSYFSTHNQFLCFCKPSKAMPPAPPKLPKPQGRGLPSSAQLAEKIPLIYAVNPFPLAEGQISWLKDGATGETVEEKDQHAFDEAERQVNVMLETEGYFDLCHVKEIRDVQRNAKDTTVTGNQGREQVNMSQSQQADDAKTFELVLYNGLVVRLKAYDTTTKSEWVTRLTDVAKYWKLRIMGDLNIYKLVRKENLERLNIDEEMESFVGQYARKWEVMRSVASPQLYNMCGISYCRTITMSGTLYRKARMHSTFKRCNLILCHGHLLIFHTSLRKHSGKELPHTHHHKQEVLDLRETYIYSGLITESDLLYQNQTFDSNHPGHHALPRVYLEDSWTSSDEDTATCFVIWYNISKSLFMANPDSTRGRTKSRLRYVSRLGVPGRSVVFKCRSRAERDHWVMSIGIEIERLQQAEEIRVVSKK